MGHTGTENLRTGIQVFEIAVYRYEKYRQTQAKRTSLAINILLLGCMYSVGTKAIVSGLRLRLTAQLCCFFLGLCQHWLAKTAGLKTKRLESATSTPPFLQRIAIARTHAERARRS